MQSYEKDVRHILTTLLVAQSFGSAAITSSATIASLVGADLSGGATWSGLPASTFQIGTALGSMFWSLNSEKLGWRRGLSTAVFVGVIGSLGAVASVFLHSFWFLLISLFIAASAQAAFNLGRFAAAEISRPEKRGRAVATVVLGGTVGSVVGPQLIAISSHLSENAGLSPWVGPYTVMAILFAIVAIIFAVFLRPEPKRLAEQVAVDTATSTAMPRALSDIFKDPQVLASIGAMVIAHGVMVMLMQITSLHMRHDQHPVSHIAWVFSSHTFGMFAFSIFSGQLIDRWGKKPMLTLGAVILLVACLSAPLSPHVLPIAFAFIRARLEFLLCVGFSDALECAYIQRKSQNPRYQ
jgi:MFS family permease